MTEPTFVLVHGAWHGPWVWNRVRHLMSDRDTIAVDLPSSGTDPRELGSLADDAALLRETVAAVAGPVVVVGHSYGGVVATQALNDLPNVDRIVYLTALPLDVGESVSKIVGRQVPEWWDLHLRDNYLDSLRPEVFYSDCPPETIRDAIARLGHQSWASFTDPVTVAAWRTIPSTYIICTADAALLPIAQGILSARASTVLRLPTSHSPMLSAPDALVDLLLAHIC